MKAIVVRSPHQIVVEDREIPEITEPTEVIISMSYSNLLNAHFATGSQKLAVN